MDNVRLRGRFRQNGNARGIPNRSWIGDRELTNATVPSTAGQRVGYALSRSDKNRCDLGERVDMRMRSCRGHPEPVVVFVYSISQSLFIVS